MVLSDWSIAAAAATAGAPIELKLLFLMQLIY